MSELAALSFGGNQVHGARSSSWNHVKAEGNDGVESAFFHGGVRAAADILDYYAVQGVQNVPFESNERAASGLFGMMQGFCGLFECIAGLEGEDRMRVMQGVGDMVVGVGLLTASIPVTMVGVGLASLGTIGAIVKGLK
ncbi:MAG: hypothetical protein HYU64_10060 [Armatimonadetes bacterium]|nr:hypothetical protein [Armatimonadota bacterium]